MGKKAVVVESIRSEQIARNFMIVDNNDKTFTDSE
jgi:hypothetical protein